MLADWDARLISPERALRLAGDWPVYYAADYAELEQFEPEGGGPRQPGQWQINMRCGKCHQSCGLFGTFEPDPTRARNVAAVNWNETSIGDELSAVLRHLVTAHELSLSGGSDG